MVTGFCTTMSSIDRHDDREHLNCEEQCKKLYNYGNDREQGPRRKSNGPRFSKKIHHLISHLSFAVEFEVSLRINDEAGLAYLANQLAESAKL